MQLISIYAIESPQNQSSKKNCFPLLPFVMSGCMCQAIFLHRKLTLYFPSIKLN